jgi:GDP-4-dehydro-6-deoxy-D-mannose reductase
MKALITGAGGFCGPHLVSRLRRESHIEICGLDRMASCPSYLSVDQYFQCDIARASEISSAISSFQPEWIFHLAGLAGGSAPDSRIYDVNLLGTIHLLEAVQRFVPRCRVLLIGSFAEYGAIDSQSLPVTEETPCHPIGAYGISKYAATLAGLDCARRAGLAVSVARPSNIVGAGVPASLVVGAMLARIKKAFASSHPLLKVGDFESERDFIGVTDAVDAYVRLMQSGVSGQIFNVCSGVPVSIRHVAELLVANSTRPVELDFDRNLVAPSAVRRMYGSYGKAERAFGFQPSTSMEEFLRSAWNAELGLVCESQC